MSNPYAQIADLFNYGAPPAAYGNLTTPQQQAALDASAAHFDSKFRARYGYQNVPIQPPIDVVITMRVCELASWNLICLRGFDGTNVNDTNIRDRGLMAIRWGDQVERQEAHPNVQIAQTDPSIAAPMIMSGPLLGWNPWQGLPATPPQLNQFGQAGNGSFGGGGSQGAGWPVDWPPPPGVF